MSSSSKANGSVVATDSRVDMGAGPKLRLEVKRREKEVNDSGLLLLLFGPWSSGGRVWGKRARYPQVVGNQELADGHVSVGFP